MKKNVCVVIGIVLGFLFLEGCSSVPLTHYYTFPPDLNPSVPAATSTYPLVLALEPFDAEGPYAQEKIVYRDSPYEVNFYEYHKWLRSPEKLATDQALKLIAATRMFKRVHARPFQVYADYVLQGRMIMFDQWRNTTPPYVRIQIEYQLMEPQEERILWTDRIDTTANITSLALVDTVKGFETALQENLLRALSALEPVVSQPK